MFWFGLSVDHSMWTGCCVPIWSTGMWSSKAVQATHSLFLSCALWWVNLAVCGTKLRSRILWRNNSETCHWWDWAVRSSVRLPPNDNAALNHWLSRTSSCFVLTSDISCLWTSGWELLNFLSTKYALFIYSATSSGETTKSCMYFEILATAIQ